MLWRKYGIYDTDQNEVIWVEPGDNLILRGRAKEKNPAKGDQEVAPKVEGE